MRTKNNQTKTYNATEENLRNLLGWESREMIVLERVFGLLRNLKKKPVQYQKEFRREWEKRVAKAVK